MKVTVEGNRVEMRLNSADGPLIGTAMIDKKGDQLISAALNNATGRQDVYFLFLDESDWWAKKVVNVQQLSFISK